MFPARAEPAPPPASAPAAAGLGAPETLPRTADVVVVAVVGLVVLRLFQGTFGFYEDEGYNLVKADLVRRGFALYRQIWSDQAPLFTWLLALPMALGAGEGALRWIPPIFGVATLLASRALAARLAGRPAGLLAVAALLCAAPFLKFSSSLVINTPALALGTWALVLAVRFGDGGSRARLVGSGLLLGAALTMKLATVYFAPVILLAVVLGPAAATPRDRAKALGVWVAALVLPLALVAPLVPAAAVFQQLLRPHTTGLAQFDGYTATARRAMLLAPGSLWLHGAGVTALAVLWWRGERRLVAVSTVWLAVMTAWMLFHRPLWSHHLPDFLVPLAVVSASGAVIALRRARAAGFLGQAALALPAVLLAIGTFVHARNHDHWRRWYDNASEDSLRAAAGVIAAHTTPEDWILVDRPILSYWARRRSPPWYALLLRKRIASGGLEDAQLVRALEEHRPAVVVLCSDRLDGFRAFKAELQRRYEIVARPPLTSSFAGAAGGQCRIGKRR